MAVKAKPDLNALLSSAAGSTRARSTPAAPIVEPREEGTRRPVQPSRVSTVAITAHFPEEVRAQLKILAIETRRPMQTLIAEAINDLFSKYGKPEIAPIGERTKAGG